MRRGQAAMEFLMTYGWAIMILLVAVGTISYFGFFKPTTVLPDKCLITAGFNCRDFKATVSADGDVTATVVLENKMGQKLIITDFNVTIVRNDNRKVNDPCVPAVPIQVSSDMPVTVTCVIQDATVVEKKGEPIKMDVTVEYRELTGSLTQIAEGEISTKLQ